MTDFLAISVQEFIDQTAAKAPTPGGGSVAALCGALSAALAQMALQYTIGKKASAAHDEELRRSLADLAAAQRRFQELIAEDIAAYAALSGLLKLPDDLRHKNPEFMPAVLAAIRSPETAMVLAMLRRLNSAPACSRKPTATSFQTSESPPRSPTQPCTPRSSTSW